MEQIKLVLEQLALIHATSYHFIQTYPGGLEKFKQDFEEMISNQWFRHDPKEDVSFERFLANQDVTFVQIGEEAGPRVRRGLLEKVKKFSLSRKKIVDQVLAVKEEQFNCIVHGDSWCNNFLFRFAFNGVMVKKSIIYNVYILI